jgi:AraC-like DNA-binding protein
MRVEYFNAFHIPDSIEKTCGIEVTWAGRYHCGHNYSCYREYGRNDYMLLYIIDGTGWYRQPGGPDYIAEAGSVLFFKPNEYQNIRCEEKNPWVLYGMHFSGKFLDRVVENSNLANRAGNLFHIGVNNELIALFEALVREIALDASGNFATVIGLAIQILGETDKALHENARRMQSNYMSSEKINRAIQYMNLNYNRKLNLNDIAAEAGYSVSRFVYLFKLYFKMSPIDFLLNERIEKAKKIIGITSLGIAEIGYSVGFSDQLYFSKAFKKRVGMSPKNYRNMINPG